MNDTTLCHYTEAKYIAVGILHSCSAAVSFIASILVITIIILFKKLKFFSQRLIFYLSLTVALYSLAAASVKTDYLAVNHQTNEYCKWVAFASQYTQWSLLMAICVITADILLRILKENSTSCYLEIVYILIIFFVPGIFNWVPFLYDYYGIAGDWCWIRDKVPSHSGKCDKVVTKAMAFQIGLWYGPLFIFCCIILITYIVIVYLLRKQRRQMSIYNPEKIQLLRSMRNEIYGIFWYPVVFMIINMFPLLNRVVSSFTPHPVFVLWILHAVISPLQGGFMSLVYALDPDTRKTLTLSSIRAACLGFFNCRGDHPVVEYHAVIGREINERSQLLCDSKEV